MSWGGKGMMGGKLGHDSYQWNDRPSALADAGGC